MFINPVGQLQNRQSIDDASKNIVIYFIYAA